jgi:exosortase/archaeosortase family protein
MTAVPSDQGLSAVRGRLAPAGLSPPRGGVRLVAFTVVIAAIFAALQTPFRHLESLAVAEGVRSLGFHGVLAVKGSEILLGPRSGLFWVDITPSCSSLGPALAIALIAIAISAGSPRSDRLLAGMAGVAGIVAGNLVRIGSSVIVGLMAGRVSLVLFHNWVGSIFGFAYTVGGFVLTLGILLRRRRNRREGS